MAHEREEPWEVHIEHRDIVDLLHEARVKESKIVPLELERDSDRQYGVHKAVEIDDPAYLLDAVGILD